MALEEYDIVETVFRKQSYPEYYGILYDFADGLDASEIYNTNRPAHLHPGQKFREHVAAMKELGAGADRGDILLKERRQAARDESELDMEASVSYLKSHALGRRDPTILRDLRLPPKEVHQKNSRRSVLSPQSVEIYLELKHLKGVSGAIVVMGKHVRYGGPYLLNLCKGEPTSEESWYNPGGHYTKCSTIILRNLEPGSRIYVRMRTDGPDGPGNWSHPVSIIVL